MASLKFSKSDFQLALSSGQTTKSWLILWELNLVYIQQRRVLNGVVFLNVQVSLQSPVNKLGEKHLKGSVYFLLSNNFA